MIRVRDLSKYYGGKRAVGPVSFDIESRETVGFLGLNGAGKSTLLRMLVSDLRPSSGSFSVGEVDGVLQPHELRKLVGFLPEVPPIYPDMTVREFLRFAGQIRGMGPAAAEARVGATEELTQLTEVDGELIRHLSHGYRQRVGVAQAIIHEPELVVLDEPTNGLDPAQIVEMRSMLKHLKEKHTVLISSHILPEIRETCDHLLVLKDGDLIASGTERELSTKITLRRIVLTVRPSTDDPDRGIQACLDPVHGVEAVTADITEDGLFKVEVEASADIRAEVCRALVEAGFGVLRLDQADPGLEHLFLELVHGGNGERG